MVLAAASVAAAFVPLSDAHLERKIAALRARESQVGEANVGAFVRVRRKERGRSARGQSLMHVRKALAVVTRMLEDSVARPVRGRVTGAGLRLGEATLERARCAS